MLLLNLWALHQNYLNKQQKKSDSLEPNDTIHKPQTAGESGSGCRIDAQVKQNISPAQWPLHDSGRNRCSGKAEGMKET